MSANTRGTSRSPAARAPALAPLGVILALAPAAAAQQALDPAMLRQQQVLQAIRAERAAMQLERDGVEPEQAEPDVPTTLEELARLVRELGADDFQKREAATARLCVAALAPEDILRALPADDSLCLEARARLQTVLLERFEKTPRAGLGASFNRDSSGAGIVLQLVVAEFPARDFLQAGDILTDVDGMSLGQDNGQFLLRAAILSRDPGELLPLTVMREGRRTAVRVPLGSYSDLQNSQIVDRETLQMAWEMRLRRLGLARPQEQAPIVIQGVAWPQPQVRTRSQGAVTIVTGGDSTSVSELDRMRRRSLVATGGQVRQAQAVVERQAPQVSPQQQLRFQVTRHRNDAEKWRLFLKENLDLAPEARDRAQALLEESDRRADAIEAELAELLRRNP